MIEVLATISSMGAPKFTAGIVLFDDVVVEAAPIIGYMKRWSRDRVRAHCEYRGWKVSVVHEMKRGSDAEAAKSGGT